jgi:hypothetical protein
MAMRPQPAVTHFPSSIPPQVTFTLPPHVISPLSGTLGAPASDFAVAFFDADGQFWTTDGVTDAEFDQQTRAVSAYLPRLTCSLALVLPRHRELPYARWLLVPTGRAICALHLHTAARRLEIRISTAGVVLAPAPEGDTGGEGALAALSGCAPCPPSVFFSRLREVGLLLCPTEHDAVPLNFRETIVTRHVVPKDRELEKELHAEVRRGGEWRSASMVKLV